MLDCMSLIIKQPIGKICNFLFIGGSPRTSLLSQNLGLSLTDSSGTCTKFSKKSNVPMIEERLMTAGLQERFKYYVFRAVNPKRRSGAGPKKKVFEIIKDFQFIKGIFFLII